MQTRCGVVSERFANELAQVDQLNPNHQIRPKSEVKINWRWCNVESEGSTIFEFCCFLIFFFQISSVSFLSFYIYSLC